MTDRTEDAPLESPEAAWLRGRLAEFERKDIDKTRAVAGAAVRVALTPKRRPAAENPNKSLIG
jgi:hypothetical protein